MKILICSHAYLPSVNGVANAVYYQYRMLSDLGHEVHILTSSGNGSEAGNYPEVVKTISITGNGRLLQPFKGEVNAYLDFLKNASYDLVLFNCWETWITETLVGRLGSTPYKKIMVSHGTSHRYWEGGFKGLLRYGAYLPYHFSFADKMKYFDHFIFLSGANSADRFYDKRYLDQQQATNWTIIPNVAEANSFDDEAVAFRTQFQLPEDKMILCVSNYGVGKGQDVAVSEFVAANPPGHILVMIGSSENTFYHKLQNLAGPLLNRKVFLLTHVDRSAIKRAYLEATFFFFCSRTEAQPLVLLDCLAAGLPFLSSNVGAVSELSGGMVYHNRQELGVLLNRFCKDHELLSRLSGEGKLAYQQHFSFAAVREKWRQMLLKQFAGTATLVN